MDDKGKRNPWAQGGNDKGPANRGPWGGGNQGGGNGGDVPPGLDDMLRRAQENFRQVMPGGMGTGQTATLVAAAIAALWLASGLYIIQPGENGVIQRFGAWHSTRTEEGLGYRIPWPVDTITKINVSQARRMEIGFDQLVGVGAGKRDIPEESLMLTADANIVNLHMVVLWNIKSAEDYAFNIEDPENTIKKVAESAIREVVGQTPMFPIITEARTQVADRALAIMTANLDAYKSGVNISQVLIQQAEVHPDVQDAFQDVQSARQDAIDVQNRAMAYRQDILPKARGAAIKMVQEAEAYRQSAIAGAEGDAQRFKEVYEAYAANKDVTRTRMYIETVEAVLKTAQKTLIDGKGATAAVPYMNLNEIKPAAGTPASTNALTTAGGN